MQFPAAGSRRLTTRWEVASAKRWICTSVSPRTPGPRSAWESSVWEWGRWPPTFTSLGIRFGSTRSIPRYCVWPRPTSPIWPTPGGRRDGRDHSGDGRLSLERELKQESPAFDVLVLDAFSSDSIPTHLLTREAFDIYLPHLAPGGAVAVHVSNRNLDLAPVLYGLVEHFELDAIRIFTVDRQHGGWSAEWIIMSRNQQLLETLRTVKGSQPPDAPTPPFPLWTDQRHNLLDVLK